MNSIWPRMNRYCKSNHIFNCCNNVQTFEPIARCANVFKAITIRRHGATAEKAPRKTSVTQIKKTGAKMLKDPYPKRQNYTVKKAPSKAKDGAQKRRTKPRGR